MQNFWKIFLVYHYLLWTLIHDTLCLCWVDIDAVAGSLSVDSWCQLQTLQTARVFWVRNLCMCVMSAETELMNSLIIWPSVRSAVSHHLSLLKICWSGTGFGLSMFVCVCGFLLWIWMCQLSIWWSVLVIFVSSAQICHFVTVYIRNAYVIYYNLIWYMSWVTL